MIEQIIFYVFAGLLILSSLMVILVRNPVHAALFLILSFFFSAGIWLLLQAEFLAIVLVLVYVGAVMVLFLFVIMMLDINIVKIREGFARYLPVGIVVAVTMAVVMIQILTNDYFPQTAETVVRHSAEYSNSAFLGKTLYTDYLFPFEIAGAILLVAIIAAISLTLRGRKDSKSQDPNKQVAVKRNDRVKLVSVPAEKQE